ncbi:MAG: hypothetical protein ACU84Q_19755 [Gammaproteobacteria bacterium]
MKHFFDFQRDGLVVLMARITGVMAGIIDIVMMTIGAFDILVVQVLERDRQYPVFADRMIMPVHERRHDGRDQAQDDQQTPIKHCST